MTMLRSFLTLILAASLSLAGCSDTPVSKSDETADTVFTNAKVYTVNEKQPWADAVAVKDGKIIYVGDNAGAEL